LSSPFDARRYKALLEGLEVTVISRSKLGEYQRVDAEFYQKEFMALEQKLVQAVPLARLLAYITDGTHVTPSYVERGVPFLSSGNVSEFIIDFSDVRYISAEEHHLS
jgi:hypothetical protein